MHQQINLYQPIFSEARKPLSFGVVLIGFLLVIAGLAGYTYYVDATNVALQATVEALRSEQSSQEALLEAGNASATQKPVTIEARVKALDRLIAARRSALEVLRSGAAGQTSGFAGRMEALARRHVDGLWIDRLVLSGTNGSMSIEGNTLSADTVPVYLRSLAHETVLSGTRFDEFVIERTSVKSAGVSELQADDAVEPTKKHSAAPRHIRFRAGSTTLATPPAASVTEAAT